jgi:hypothetical protein
MIPTTCTINAAYCGLFNMTIAPGKSGNNIKYTINSIRVSCDLVLLGLH